jgi:hypothetical protein
MNFNTVGGALTSPFVNITGTWNTSGVVDAAIFMNITTTAEGAASKLIDLQSSSTSEFAVDYQGNMTLGKGGQITLQGLSSGTAVISTSSTGVLALPSGTTATNMALTTPAIGAATGTSLLVTGIVDGEAPVTLATTSCTLGTTSGCNATAYNSGYTFNEQTGAVGTEITFTLPTAAAGKQYCVANDYNGSAANTGILRINTSAAGQHIRYKGVVGATGGYIRSGGAAGDAACFVGLSATDWNAYVQSGTWTQDSGG